MRSAKNLFMKEKPGNGRNPASSLSPRPSSGGEMGYPVLRESSNDRRRGFIEQWRNAPERVIKYKGGTVTNKDGITYSYDAGTRLLIGHGEKANQVMDTCETPWAFATVDRAFIELAQKSEPLKILERGFGMGITARRVIQHLVTRAGQYSVIELNKENADYARTWKERQDRAIAGMASGMQGARPNIDIGVIEGESYEETARLAEGRRKFDIIISDTYPLSPDEEGINDLQDLDTLKQCLLPGGIFAFFSYFPGSTDDVVNEQINMITKHFGNYGVSRATVAPPPDYEYLQTPTGAVRKLPVVICKNPLP